MEASSDNKKTKTLDEEFTSLIVPWIKDFLRICIPEASYQLQLMESLRQKLDWRSDYEHYLKKLQFTEEMKCDFAKVVACELFSGAKPEEVVPYMADSLQILIDDEKSKIWLEPYVRANRTSFAYERATRLIYKKEYGLAQSILQIAANEGDNDAAMLLIRDVISTRAAKADAKEPKPEPHHLHSIAFEQGHVYMRWENWTKAREVMQRAADGGDVECAMFLIKNKVIYDMQISYDGGPF